MVRTKATSQEEKQANYIVWYTAVGAPAYRDNFAETSYGCHTGERMPEGLALVFGWWGDGQTWPEMPAPKAACLGEAVLGPAGLLDTLETALGLGGPPISHVKRIAAWQAKMHLCNDGSRFWSRSYKVDPWATARLILNWRDELVEAGWKPSIVGSTRFRDIAAIETTNPPTPPGTADRLQRLTAALGPGRVPIRSVQLIDAREILPTGWRGLLNALQSSGVVITPLPSIEDTASGDLKVLRTPETKTRLSGDGSVNVLFADTELTAAECLGGWLSSEPGQGRTVIIAGRATELLDSYLADRGLPKIGVTDRSAFRGALQVLSLAFATSWAPFDPRPLLGLLLLPRPPVPRRVAREFARVLRDRPGQGDESWQNAWQVAADWLAKQPKVDEEKSNDAARLAEWHEWIEPKQFQAEPGMPAEAAVAICARVQQWAYSRDQGLGDAILVKVAQVAGELADAIGALALPVLSRPLLERMLDQVVADGMENPLAVTEASEWTAVTHPGAIWGAVDRLIWWGFDESGELPKAGTWSNAERKVLEIAGCPLDPISIALERHSASWRRAIAAAQQQLILIRTRGEKPAVHPIWHELSPKLQNAAVGIVSVAEDIMADASPRIGSRSITRLLVRFQSAPTKRRMWQLPAAIPRPASTSPSAIEDLLTCPLRWTLGNLMKIRRGILQRVAGEEQLLGNLAHEIARSVFIKGTPPTPDAAKSTAEQLFSKLIPQIAAPLALPGYAALHEEARQQIPHAIGELAKQLRQSGLTIEGCEIEATGTLPDGTTINGRIDLLARDVQGKPIIVDLKWARRETLYRQKLETGEAIQLAAYCQLVTAGSHAASAGYFLIRHSALLGSEDGPFSSRNRIAGPDMAATWQATTDAWQSRLAPILAGRVIATGIALEEGASDADVAPTLSLKPPCHYCEYHGICGGSREEN